MTRNIISHDSRRRGNTKYYSAEELRLAGSRRTVSCILLLAAARRTCGGHEIADDKLAFARHDAAAKSARASVSRARDPAASARRSNDPNFRPAAKQRARAFCICHLRGGVIYRSYFPSRASAKGIRRGALRPFLRPALRSRIYRSLCIIFAIVVLSKLNTLHSHRRVS